MYERKLQKIKDQQYTLTIPPACVSQLRWKKQDVISFSVDDENKTILLENPKRKQELLEWEKQRSIEYEIERRQKELEAIRYQEKIRQEKMELGRRLEEQNRRRWQEEHPGEEYWD